MSQKHYRKKILQKLYRDEFHSSSSDQKNQKAPQFVFEEKALKAMDSQYVIDILNGVKSKRENIDKIINKYIQNWRQERVSLVDWNIMRIAVFEILFYPDTPGKVALNEAVELAKQFGEKNSASFINGILDQTLKKESKPTNLV